MPDTRRNGTIRNCLSCPNADPQNSWTSCWCRYFGYTDIQHSPETLIPRELLLLPILMPSCLPTCICHYLSPAVEIVLWRQRAFKMAALLSPFSLKNVFASRIFERIHHHTLTNNPREPTRLSIPASDTSNILPYPTIDQTQRKNFSCCHFQTLGKYNTNTSSC